ncbi:MAG TPA: hypothetical protein GX733_01130 [Tissierellia bacterium]|jgi:hypothetical protein|nr:hypothetical protein [Tissierellia bacterium]
MKDKIVYILCVLLILVLITQVILLNRIERVIKSVQLQGEYAYSRLERHGVLLLEIRDLLQEGDEPTEQE